MSAFEQGVTLGSFCDSLIRSPAESFSEIRRRAVAHINLGGRKDIWCEFHKGFEHGIDQCMALGYQFGELLREGFLKEYLEADQGEPQKEVILRD